MSSQKTSPNHLRIARRIFFARELLLQILGEELWAIMHSVAQIFHGLPRCFMSCTEEEEEEEEKTAPEFAARKIKHEATFVCEDD